MRLRGSDLHTLAGAYALDAVTDADRARFERHLAGCEACRQEIRGLREATARLAAASAVQPSAAFREATLRAAGRTRQLPPVVRGRAAAGPARRRLARRWWLPGLVAGVAAALAVIAVVTGLIGPAARHQMDPAQLRNHTIAAVLNAPDATMLTAKVSTGGTATVVMSHRVDALVFMAAHLRPLPAADRYELWLMGPRGARPAGMLPAASRAGMVGPMVVSGLAAGDRVGLTVEPAMGMRRPTAPPLLDLRLTR
jgi:Anti-sigma-K factor rskA/Putative zinc-finger